MLYLKIQTNRAKIKEIIGQFYLDYSDGEVFIAPRPKPREYFKFYFGYACVFDGSKNNQALLKIKNHTILDEQSYEDYIKEIEYLWRVPKKTYKQGTALQLRR